MLAKQLRVARTSEGIHKCAACSALYFSCHDICPSTVCSRWLCSHPLVWDGRCSRALEQMVHAHHLPHTLTHLLALLHIVSMHLTCFAAACTADPSLQAAITAVGFSDCKSVPQTSSGGAGPLPNLSSACCSLRDPTKPLYGSVSSASGMCTGGRLVPTPTPCSQQLFASHSFEQIVTLYTDTGCSSVATAGSVTYKDFAIPLGCTNTGSGITTVGTTADCNPGQFLLPLLLVCHVSKVTFMLAASHLSVSFMFSCSPPSPLLTASADSN